MGDATSISWTDATWNPIRGCRRVSPGCENCYAERQALRFAGKGGAYEGLVVKLKKSGARWTGATRVVAEHLADPLRWKKPRRIFVDSMSDLFYEGFTYDQITAVFSVMAACPQHTFQVLTKRARGMREWFDWMGSDLGPRNRIAAAHAALEHIDERLYDKFLGVSPAMAWPLPNVWIGVSVENQKAADERVPELVRVPAAVHFLSCEPLLGPIDLAAIHGESIASLNPAWLDWVIAGCESGPGARRCDVAWLRSLRDQCSDAGVAFFLKQANAVHCTEWRGFDPVIAIGAGSKRKGGGVVELPYLDDIQHAAFPKARS